MPIFTFANNVSTTLAGAFSSSATSFTLSSSANLPTIPSGQYWAITLNDAATRGNFEIIYVGAITGATCSNLLRGQEGTAQLSWLTNDFAYSAPTKGQQASFGQLAAANAWAEANTFTDSGTGGVIVAGTSNTNGANIELEGNGATTPSKYIRAQDGSLQVLNNAYSAAIMTLTDAGALSVPGTLSGAVATAAGNAVLLSQFAGLLSGNGYIEFPIIVSGIPQVAILQFGSVVLTSSGVGETSEVFGLPRSFPTAGLNATASFGGTAPPANGSPAAFVNATNQITITLYTQSAGNFAVNYFAVGY